MDSPPSPGRFDQDTERPGDRRPVDLEHTIGSAADGGERCVIHPPTDTAEDEPDPTRWVAADHGSFVSLDETR